MNKTNCILLIVTLIFIFVYLDFLEIPIFIDRNVSNFLTNPLIRFICVILILYVAENISFIFALFLVVIYVFLFNNSLRSGKIERLSLLGETSQMPFGVGDESHDPIHPPGSSQTPKGPEPLYPNNQIGPLPFRPCESALASGVPDMLPPKGQGFLGDPSGPYTDSGVGCSF